MRGVFIRVVAVSLAAAILSACAHNGRPASAPVAYSATPGLWPVDSPAHVISSAYGVPRDRKGDFHHGVDLRAPKGTPVLAAAPGTVAFAGNGSGYGHYVLIDHGNGYTTLYAHLLDINVRAGDRVALAQRIGSVGKSGNATGYHLHYEVHRGGQPVNPQNYLP